MTDTSFSFPPYTSSRWLPHARVDQNNPIFRLTGLTDPGTLRQRTMRWIMWGCLPLLGFWLIYFFAHVMNGEDWQRDMRYAESFGLLGWITMASLADKLLLDFVAVLVSLGKTRREFQRENWDLICMTNISTERIVKAKHALAQINVWRMTSVVVGFRLSIVIVLFFQLFIAPNLLFDDGLNFDGISPTDMLGLMLFATGFFILCLAYMIEPRWRIRALTAGSIAVSSQLLSSTFMLLSALGAVVGFWITQAIIMGMVFFITYTLLVAPTGIFIESSILAGIFSLLYVLLFVGTIYVGYLGVENFWLNNAKQRLIARGGMN